jgi:hypothetical protein
LTAKLSDLGASRCVPINQTGVTASLQGTFGYLDPMYYYTGRLTDKSDVFSFVVFSLSNCSPEINHPSTNSDSGDSLVSHFVSLLTEGDLVNTLDPQVMEERYGEVQEVAALVATCTELNGEGWPTMREVEMALENLRAKKRPVTQPSKL